MQVNAAVLGTTHRYKNKYVTTVVYKPRRVRSHVEQPGISIPAEVMAQQGQHDYNLNYT